MRTADEILDEKPYQVFGNNKVYLKHYITEAMEEFNNQWTPVSESLPKTDGYYIVTMKYGQSRIDVLNMYFYVEENIWRDDKYREYSWDVIAWKPLPEPFEEK